MSLFKNAKKEVEELDLCVSEWTCKGKVFKIPLINGVMKGNERLAELGDKIDAGFKGAPSELIPFMGDFMVELLSKLNHIDEDLFREIANPVTVGKVFKVWYGQE